MILGPILRIGVGMDHMIVCSQKRRIWKWISNLGQSMVSSPFGSETARPLDFLLECHPALDTVSRLVALPHCSLRSNLADDSLVLGMGWSRRS